MPLIDVILGRKVVLDCPHSMVALIRGTKLYLDPAGCTMNEIWKLMEEKKHETSKDKKKSC